MREKKIFIDIISWLIRFFDQRCHRAIGNQRYMTIGDIRYVFWVGKMTDRRYTICLWIGDRRYTICLWIGDGRYTICFGIGDRRYTICSWIGDRRYTICSWVGDRRYAICFWIGDRRSVWEFLKVKPRPPFLVTPIWFEK